MQRLPCRPNTTSSSMLPLHLLHESLGRRIAFSIPDFIYEKAISQSCHFLSRKPASFLTSRLKSFGYISRPLLPFSMDDDIERVLWTADEIAARISELAAQITEDFRRSSSPVVVVGVATGAFLFLADVVRRITLPIAVDFIRAESYGSGTQSNGAPIISCDVKLDISGKHVMLVEDVVDTGNTLSCLISHLKSKGANSVSVCTLLDKPARRTIHFELVGEGKFYCGFECPDHFVVGYGLDLAELYRNLPYIGVLKPEKYK